MPLFFLDEFFHAPSHIFSLPLLFYFYWGEIYRLALSFFFLPYLLLLLSLSLISFTSVLCRFSPRSPLCRSSLHLFLCYPVTIPNSEFGFNFSSDEFLYLVFYYFSFEVLFLFLYWVLGFRELPSIILQIEQPK